MSFAAKPNIFGHNWLPELNTVFNFQDNEQCKDFELRYGDCMAAYGLLKGQDKCSDYLEDLIECYSCAKRMLRVKIMSVEREEKKGKDHIQDIRSDLLL